MDHGQRSSLSESPAITRLSTHWKNRRLSTEPSRPPFPTQLVHDLLWVVNSPSLIKIVDNENTDEVPPITEADIEVDRLMRFFEAGVTRRVGKYFERLVLFWLEHVRQVELVAHGRQIREDKITLGEIDFLFHDERGCLTHMEVAVKFYLHHRHSAINGSHFVGPNVNDTFERKMTRLFEHQLPLSHEHVDGIEFRTAMVKGRIFYESNEDLPSELPPRMSADHLKSRWVRLFQFLETEETTSFRYEAISKPYWLSTAVRVAHESGLMAKEQFAPWLKETIHRRRGPVMIRQLSDMDGGWNESSRWFIVPDNWPM